MKREVFDLLDGYEEERLYLEGTTPLSARRIRDRTVSMLKRKEKRRRAQHHSRLLRGLLVAAAVGALCCVTALAVLSSLRELARADMGISTAAPVPEWSEYETTGEATGESEPWAELTAALCAGERLYAYLEAGPVSPDVAKALAENAAEYEWWPSEITLSTCSILLEQMGYDQETRTALVKASFYSQELAEAEEVGFTLQLRQDGRTEETYGAVTIPIVEQQTIRCEVDIPVKNTTDDLAANLHPEDIVLLTDYELEGRLTGLSLSVGQLEVVLEAPNVTEWLAASGAGQIQGNSRGLPPEIQEGFLRSLYLKSWSAGVNEALEGMTLHLWDGTSVAVEDLPVDGAGGWSAAENKPALMYDGTVRYEFVLSQALDLSTARSVTVGGVEYALPAAEWSGE